MSGKPDRDITAAAAAKPSFPTDIFSGGLPGNRPASHRPDMAWRLEPGSDLVIEMHLMPGATTEKVQASVGLFFTNEAPTKTAYMLRLGRQDIDIAAGQRDYISEDSYTLPVDVEVLGGAATRALSRQGDSRDGEAARWCRQTTDLHQGLGLSLAGHVSARIAIASPKGHGLVDAIHLRQFGEPIHAIRAGLPSG